MTIKYRDKNVSAENKNWVLTTPVTIDSNGILTIAKENFYNDETGEVTLNLFDLGVQLIVLEDDNEKTALQKLNEKAQSNDPEIKKERKSHGYLIEHPDSTEQDKWYSEYFWIESKQKFEALGSTKADLNPLKNEINDLKNRATILEGKTTSLEGRATNLESRATSLEGRATDLEDRATNLEDRATDLEGKTTSLEGRATILEGKTTSLEGRATNLEGRATDLEDRATDLEGKTTSLEGRATDLEDRATNIENNKVDKISGKGLSTNDYTNEEKQKLQSLKPTDIVNDLSTGGSSSALSAEQGKILNNTINEILDYFALNF